MSLVLVVWYNSTVEVVSYTTTVTARDYSYECFTYRVINNFTSYSGETWRMFTVITRLYKKGAG
jgi:hypothetical protein